MIKRLDRYIASYHSLAKYKKMYASAKTIHPLKNIAIHDNLEIRNRIKIISGY